MNKALFLLFTFYILIFAGCATAPYTGTALPPKGMPGIYHRVERGQTLWKISKIYTVDLDEIATVNHIPDTASIEEGQLIFIPNRQKQRSYDTGSSSDDFAWPVRGKVITAFGQTYNNMINKGVNIQPYRNSDVLAARSGRVSFYADGFGNFGKTIIIEHSDGFSTVYTRNSEVFVKAGDSVQKGTVIAKVGFAGRDRNTYLHFEIRKGHIPQNPFFYLP